jgi:hypothetical protein
LGGEVDMTLSQAFDTFPKLTCISSSANTDLLCALAAHRSEEAGLRYMTQFRLSESLLSGSY